MPVSDVIQHITQEERDAWKIFYKLYGPLDWRRNDLLDARKIRYELGVTDETDETFLRFPEPRLKTAEDYELEEEDKYTLEDRLSTLNDKLNEAYRNG